MSSFTAPRRRGQPPVKTEYRQREKERQILIFQKALHKAGNFGYGGQLYKPSQIIHQQQIINPGREIKRKVLTLWAVKHQLMWAQMAFSAN